MFRLYGKSGLMLEGKSTNGSWNLTIPELITRLEYQYVYSRKLVLQGYKEYNHLVEKTAIVGSGLPPLITKIFIMGRKEEVTDIFTIDLKTRHITQKTVAIGQEYQGQITTGWKPGLYNNPGWDDG